MSFKIAGKSIGMEHPVYFIADVAANHDGKLDRAKELIRLAAESGADAAKFQNFSASKIVSDYGFRSLGQQKSHQSTWEKSVFEVYQDASIPDEWTPTLKSECDKHGIDYFSAPYDFDAIDMLDPFVPAFKVGSGDVTWLAAIRRMAKKGKPILIATGAASIGDVQSAVHAAREVTEEVCIMQCNTNYTGAPENVAHINLNVLKTYAAMWPDLVLGLSDHTAGHASVLGAVALGARIVEKHFTDDTGRLGPDHAFSMDPSAWRSMVDTTRELEAALGSGDKKVEPNERETVILQRRCLRASRALPSGSVLTLDDVDVLRPAVPGGLIPEALESVLGRTTTAPLAAGQELTWAVIG